MVRTAVSAGEGVCACVGGMGLFVVGGKGATGGGAGGAVCVSVEEGEGDEGVGGPRAEEVAEGRGEGAEGAVGGWSASCLSSSLCCGICLICVRLEARWRCGGTGRGRSGGAGGVVGAAGVGVGPVIRSGACGHVHAFSGRCGRGACGGGALVGVGGSTAFSGEIAGGGAPSFPACGSGLRRRCASVTGFAVAAPSG